MWASFLWKGAPNPPAANQIVNASKLQLGELFTREKLERGLNGIKQLMEQNGYYRSSVTDEEQPQVETQQMNVLFRLVPGDHARVGRITVNGPAGFSVGQIQDIAKMHTGDYVTVQRVSRALDRLRKKYQKQDRLLSQVAIAGRVYLPASNTVDYTFDIDPGPKVEIAVEGLKISRGQIKKNVPVYEENALDDDLLNEGRRNLLNYVQGLGYFDAKVTVKKNPVSTGEMRVTYNIDAGRTAQAGEAGDHGQPYLQRRPASGPHADSAGRALSGAWALQPVALERGCAQPHR